MVKEADRRTQHAKSYAAETEDLEVSMLFRERETLIKWPKVWSSAHWKFYCCDVDAVNEAYKENLSFSFPIEFAHQSRTTSYS